MSGYGKADVYEPTVQQPFIATRQNQRRPNDYLVLSILNAFCCLCGFIPLICSLKSRDHYYLGQIAEAERKGKQARCWNIVTIILAVVFIITTIVITTILQAAVVAFAFTGFLLTAFDSINKNGTLQMLNATLKG